MPEIGQTISHYRIMEKIGVGGMGEVYLAEDLSLDRKVALKFLPDVFTGDPERMARFEREAKLLASLNHPNIAAIYGLEQADGKRFLIMEYVEGETLQARISKGALPLDEALAVCRQIAEGLEAAHEKGVIHRDLKPANVMITTDEKVKILDFGLAKAFSDETQSIDSSQSPTLTEAMTRPGVILGTAAYMSPEQAKGKSVDKRADIWAFGCILYECLTGKRVFEGETVTETLASVIKEEPEWNALPASTPLNIKIVLRRCLNKDKSRRYRDAADVNIEIEEGISNNVLIDNLDKTLKSKAGMRLGIIAAIACLVLGFVGAVIALRYLKTDSNFKPISKLSINLPPNQTLQSSDSPVLAISPDGTWLAYVSSINGNQQIFRRDLDSFEAVPIAGTEGGTNPFFQPEGEWLGFVANGKLMKVPIKGGAPLRITSLYSPRGIYWGENETIQMAPAWGEHGLAQISETGKNETVLTHRDSSSAGHMYPQLLPGGEAILYTDYKRNIEDSRIMIRFLKTGKEEELIKGGVDGRYVPTGHIVFVREGNLFAVPFNIDQMERGEIPVRILEGVMHSISEDIAQYSFSENGTLAYVRGGVQGADRKLVLVGRTGKEQSLDEKLQGYSSPHFSPDGQKIVLTIQANNDDIWTYDIADRYWTQLTTQGRNIQPIWTHDGNRIIFRSDLKGQLSLYWIPSEGGRVEPLLPSEYQQAPTATSPDGKLLAYGEFNPTTGWDIGIMPFDKKEEAYLLLETPDNEVFGCFSPDGKYLAYGSDKSSREEIYVTSINGSGGPWPITTEGGSHPVWAKNWELFYQNGEKVMVVDTDINTTFEHGKPKELFERKFDAFDVTQDGKRFLFIEPGEIEKTRGEINVILNWFEELKERVPVD